MLSPFSCPLLLSGATLHRKTRASPWSLRAERNDGAGFSRVLADRDSEHKDRREKKTREGGNNTKGVKMHVKHKSILQEGTLISDARAAGLHLDARAAVLLRFRLGLIKPRDGALQGDISCPAPLTQLAQTGDYCH